MSKPRQDRPRAAGGSSSGAPSECSFESENLSLSAAYSGAGEGGRCAGTEKRPNEFSLSSIGGPVEGSDEPTDEGQEFSSDSMSDQTESAVEPVRGLAAEPLDPIEQLDLATGLANSAEQQTVSTGEQTGETETGELSGEQNEPGTRGGIQFFFKVSV